jgi:hypothetical protein
MKDFIEQRILEAVRGLLTGKVNEMLGKMEYPIPIIEFGNYGCVYAVAPIIILSSCESSEKERIIRLETYSMTITLELPETPESELYCYAYSSAIGWSVYDNPTFDGVVERAVITGKKYCPPKKPNCGQGWEVTLNLRIIVEGVGHAG